MELCEEAQDSNDCQGPTVFIWLSKFGDQKFGQFTTAEVNAIWEAETTVCHYGGPETCQEINTLSYGKLKSEDDSLNLFAKGYESNLRFSSTRDLPTLTANLIIAVNVNDYLHFSQVCRDEDMISLNRDISDNYSKFSRNMQSSLTFATNYYIIPSFEKVEKRDIPINLAKTLSINCS